MIDILIWLFIWLGRIFAVALVLLILFFAYIGFVATWQDLKDDDLSDNYGN